MPIDTNVLNERMNNLIDTNKKEHREMMTKLDAITRKLDNLDEGFPTRVEFTTSNERIKNIENVLKGAGGMVMVAVLGSLLKLVVS